MRKQVSVIMFFAIILIGISGMKVMAIEKTKTISIADFTKKLEKVTGIDENSLYRDNEFQNREKDITNGEAALLIDRADESINGNHYKKKVYEQVIKKKRITGLKGIGAKKKDAIYKCFVKGIMPGKSNGAYTQSRNFNANKSLERIEVNGILERLVDKKKRVKLSPDGQVIRTTNLPKNYKNFSYILASFPNSFYEKKTTYERSKWGKKPKEFKDYTRPKNLRKRTFTSYWGIKYKMSEELDKYQDIWCKKVEDNLWLRLSFDYQTVSNRWINELRKTYIIYDDKEMDKDKPKYIRKYASIAKKNKVKLQVQQVVVEPSTMYEDSGFWVRAHVKFKLCSVKEFYSAKSCKQNYMIYGNDIYLQYLRPNKWYEADFDLQLTGNNMEYNGAAFGISDDSLDDSL
ncbi:hypothetical protein [Velocimicrobium porci]|uniref:Uncharacterized protein n=1 Tax=Velocimicrobium porci TaxID=2606634 RepID=A0A6L5XV74_9FIRM|nr:hypothetical protein [Velocimicrobium porci]MSS62524.1 hypothetical protein [Velocimicrobium porci]